MKTSTAFKVLIRIVGAVGLLAGLSMASLSGMFLMTKAPEIHLPSLFVGISMILVSIYCLCGAPYLQKAVGRQKNKTHTISDKP